MILIELLGAAMMTTFNKKTTWAEAYETEDIGGLLGASLVGPMGGFGSFLMSALALHSSDTMTDSTTVILGLSIIANNIPNIYSFAMTFRKQVSFRDMLNLTV